MAIKSKQVAGADSADEFNFFSVVANVVVVMRVSVCPVDRLKVYLISKLLTCAGQQNDCRQLMRSK